MADQQPRDDDDEPTPWLDRVYSSIWVVYMVAGIVFASVLLVRML